MIILGISAFYHDSSACLLENGKIVAAAAEERFSRIKHDHGWPEQAIDFCLKFRKISSGDIDHIVFYEKPFLKFDRILDTYIRNFPLGYGTFHQVIPSWVRSKLHIKYFIKRKLGKIPYFVSHHLSHAAAAFFLSGFTQSAVITFDGVGEWNTLSISKGNGNDIEILKVMDFPDSLGLLYSAITAFLGFKVNSGEGKVMGLASYGKPAMKQEFSRLLRIFDDGSFKLNRKYFAYEHSKRMYSKEMIRLFGEPRIPEGPITKRDEDLAATLQWFLEEIALKISAHAKEITGSSRVCYGGGVVLNSVMNGKLLKSGIFDEYFFLPIGGDGGAAVGCAAFLYAFLTKNAGKQTGFEKLTNLFWGPSYSKEVSEKALTEAGLSFRTVDDTEAYIASKLAQGKIVGWFEGRMEMGQRALGGRSILTDSRDPAMKDILNEKVKHRESFRPFAPVVREEDFESFFGSTGTTSPFMILCLPVMPEKDSFKAGIHVDNTGRVQTVNERENPKIYRIVSEFGKITGVPVIINTSFNLRGEPIVCSPKDAVETFVKTHMDILVLDGLICEK